MKLSYSNLGIDKKNLRLAQHDTRWTEYYKEFAEEISNCLNGIDFKINHIGSTSLPIIAKPVIDILITSPNTNTAEKCVDALVTQKGFCNSFEQHMEKKDENGNLIISLHNYGRNSGGYKLGSPWDNALIFKHHMLNNPQDLAEYEKLKTCIASQYKDTGEYYKRKESFIESMLIKARKQFSEDEIAQICSL